MSLQFKLLGSLSIETDGVPSDLLKSPKGCALVVYLIITGQPHSREFLADLLWDVESTARGLRNLRALLIRIRDLVPELQVTRTNLAFQPHPETSVDFLRLQAALELDPAQMEDSQLDAALRLYRGELLANFHLEGAPRFEEWLTIQREKIRRSVLDGHHALCQSLADQHRWQEGGEAAARWLAIDPFDEEAIGWQMQFMGASGQASAALKAYEAYKNNIRNNFGLEPEKITQTLANELQAAVGSFEAITFPAPITLAGLDPDDLPDPGPLPVNTILPFQRNDDFVGREETLLQIASVLGTAPQDGRVPAAALTGIGGIGKTQTAVEFCCRYGRFFPGGVFWLNFEEADGVAGEMVMIGSERGLGLYLETDGLSLNDQLGRVQRALQEAIPRLLIFDNCEDEALFTKWRPVTGGCRILLTSRQIVREWSAGVQAIPLNVLEEFESIDLLQKLAPHITDDDASAIANEVGHLPLALHLAGSFLNRYQEIDPARYIKQLQEKGLLQHPSLQGRGTGQSPTGHELSVVRTYLVNWEKLNPANPVDAIARQLLVCAANFAPAEPIPVGWLKEIVHGDADDDLNMILQVEDGLSKLINLGFLSRLPNQMVALHPLLASFTSMISEEKETERAHMAVGTLLAQTLSEHRQKEGHLSILPISSVHVRYISEVALFHKTTVAVNLATLLGLHLMNIGEGIEAQQILERACAVAEEIGDTLGHARALVILASTQESLGHDDESLQSAKEAVELFKKSDGSDTSGLAEAFYRQGWAHYRLGQAKAALDAAEEGYHLGQRAHLQGEIARCLNLMGVVNYYMLGRYATAQEQLEESLAMYRQMGNRQAEAIVLNNMGENARLQGGYSLAAGYYEEALNIARDIENQNKVNTYLCNLCSTRVRLGQFGAAIDELQGLIAIVGPDWFGLSEAHRFLSEAYLGQGKTTRALEMAQQALAFAYPSNPFEHGCAWRALALVAAQLGEPIQPNVEDEQTYDAEACFRRSLDFFKVGEFERDRAITLWHWAQYELEQGNEQGQAMWQEAKDIFIRLNLPLMIAWMEGDTHKQ